MEVGFAASENLKSCCCIAGGGTAGMMLGFLPATRALANSTASTAASSANHRCAMSKLFEPTLASRLDLYQFVQRRASEGVPSTRSGREQDERAVSGRIWVIPSPYHHK